jgi:hypothetical protein
LGDRHELVEFFWECVLEKFGPTALTEFVGSFVVSNPSSWRFDPGKRMVAMLSRIAPEAARALPTRN